MLFDLQQNRKLMLVLKPFLPYLLSGVLLSVLAGVLGLFAIWCVIQLIGNNHEKWLVLAVVFWGGAALCSVFSAWLAHFSEARFSTKLRRKIVAHIARLPAHQFANYKNDKFKRLISDDTTALHHLVAHLPAEVANLLILPCITIVFLVFETQTSALIVLIPGLLAGFCYLVIIPKLTAQQANERFDVMAEITTAISDYGRGSLIHRTYLTDSGPLTKFKSATQHFIQGMLTRIKRVATIVAIATAMLQAVATFTIAYSLGSHWPIDELAALLFFSLAIVTPALQLGHGLDYVSAGKKAAGRIEDFLNTPLIAFGQEHYTPEHSGTLVVNQVSQQINAQVIQQRVSFSVLSGTLLAISGESGVGKSSLLRVLAGFESEYLGTILYQGIDCSTLHEEVWPNLVMLLPQGLGVLDTSVQENLALTQPNATDEQYLNALQQARLEVPLSQSTTLMSGGEKQRLNLARAFLSPTPIILLDEPTSALDTSTAMECIQNIKQHAKHQHKIIIMVTHDPKLIKMADKRLYLEANSFYGETS
jgi:ATP-binding cassette subfamily B protein